MRAMASWCVRHRWAVVTSWIGVLVLTTVIGHAIGTSYSNNFNLPGTESTRALHLIQSASPALSGDTDQIVFATSGGEFVTDATVRAKITATLEKVARVAHVSRIVAPFGFAGGVAHPNQVSADHTIAYASITFNVPGFRATAVEAKQFVSVATSDRGSHFDIAVAGQLAEGANSRTLSSTWIGAVAAGIVLLLVFGSFAAALMPLASALVALGIATGIIGMITHVFLMPVFAPQLVILIGLGVGVDYALFIVTRHRQGLLQGLDIETSIVQSVNTSGRAVLFAGIIVCIALLGMFAIGVSFLAGLAVGASIGVAFTMLAALTLLPAILGFVGPRILSRRQRRTLAQSGPRTSNSPSTGFWSWWSGFIDGRPAIPAVVALVLIGLLAAPFFSIRLGAADQGNDPVGTTTRTAYDLLAKGFGAGSNGPLLIVAEIQQKTDLATLRELSAKVALTPGVNSVSSPLVLPVHTHGALSGYVVMVSVIPKSSPQGGATNALISKLRTDVIPSTIRGTHLVVLVGGVTAIFADFAHVLATKLPLFIGLVVLLSFLLLAVVFRSLLVPLLSAVMNLLSIGAAFGVLTAVFQWGWLGGLIGVNRAGPVEAFLPPMLFAILFGLSMDYQVFLVSRMHEEWLKSGDNRTAIRLGLARTGKTITAAAAIMIVVFASFILGGQRVIKEFGLGLAGGVLVDAIVIRMAIVPAVMRIFGRANWWFPKGLDRMLPKFGLEAQDAASAIGE